MAVSIAAQGQGRLDWPGTPNVKPALANGEGWWIGAAVRMPSVAHGAETSLYGYDSLGNNTFADHSEVGVSIPPTGGTLKINTYAHRMVNWNDIWANAGLAANFAAQTPFVLGADYLIIHGVQDVSGSGDWRMMRAMVDVATGTILGRQVSSGHADVTAFATAVHRGIARLFFDDTASGSGSARTLGGTALEHVAVIRGRFPLVSGNLDPVILAGLVSGAYKWDSPEVLNGGTLLDWRKLADNADRANYGTNGLGDLVLTGTVDTAAEILPWSIADVVLSAGDTASLSAAELASAVWITDTETPAVGLGPVTFRWKSGAAESGDLVGVDAAITVVADGAGTSPSRYSFAGTHMRRAQENAAITDIGDDPSTGTKRVVVVDHAMHMPDYPTSEHRFHIPNSYMASAGLEYKTTTDIIIHKASVKIMDEAGMAGTWYPIPGLPMTITPSMDGGWLPALTAGITVPANAKILLRYVYELPTLSGDITVFPLHSWKHVGYGDKQQGYTGAQLATALALVPTSGTAQTDLGNSSGRWLPASMCVAKGGDGRPAFVIIGDSNGYPGFSDTIQSAFTDRGEWGYLNIGLDDNATSKRLAFANICVVGQGYTGYQNRSRWQIVANAIKYIKDTYGEWPFDEVLDEMVENSLSASAVSDIVAYQTLLKTEWGKPVIKVQSLNRITSSSDQYATVAGQTVDSVHTYPTGGQWLLNAALEPGGSLRTAGLVDDTFAPWKYECANPLTNDRDVLAVKPFTTTLAAGISGGAPAGVQLTHAPTIGAALVVAGYSGYMHIYSISGSGPYTITQYSPNGFTGTASAGAVVREVAHGDGLHPSAAHHRYVLAQAMIDYKIARGWF